MSDGFVSLATSFQNDIFGQPRTSRYKQYVILKSNWVFKGPYNSERLEKLQNRTKWFRKWKTPLIVLPIEILNTTDGTFAKYQNLITEGISGTRWNTESFTGNKYRVINRTDLLKFNQGILKAPWVCQKYGEPLLLALVHMWILKIGDTGFANMLIKNSTHQVYIIDFDETTGRDKDNPEFYFSRPAGKKYKWYQQMKPHYLKVATRIKEMLNQIENQSFFSRIKQAVQLLIKYGSESPVEVTVLNGSQPPVIISPLEFNTISQPTLVLNVGQPNIGSSSNPQDFENTPSRNIGRMVWTGLFNGTKTFHGYDLDIGKSAVQKGIRRGMIEFSLQAGFELWRLAEVGGKAGQTNLYNRLAVIAAEDVGPPNLNLVIYVVNYVLTDVKSGVDRSAVKLATIIQQLAISKKTRIMSHIWRAYTNPTGRSMAVQMGFTLDMDSFDSKVFSDLSLNRFFKEGDPKEIIPLAKMFYIRLQERNFNAVWWVYQYLQILKNNKKLKVKSRRRRTKPMIIIWEMMRDFLGSKIVDVLSRAYFTLSEGRPFLMTAITTILYSNNKMEIVSIDQTINQGIQIWSNHPFLTKLRNSDYNFTVPEYVIDMHTKEGRRRGKNRQNFVQEGALITNLDSIYYDQKLDRIYNS
uniref:Protein kinase n=1 Tax=Pithovirus LCPAC201 TaxID=2506591 RepID=A0A481Z760_9VIRU|nr:MAG: uncharacterized protein LCPAC201_02800 [Pithovirus LCPAC201]